MRGIAIHPKRQGTRCNSSKALRFDSLEKLTWWESILPAARHELHLDCLAKLLGIVTQREFIIARRIDQPPSCQSASRRGSKVTFTLAEDPAFRSTRWKPTSHCLVWPLRLTR